MRSLEDEITFIEHEQIQKTIHPLIGLDFETYSDVDLTKVGLHNYAVDPSFRVLLAAVAVPGKQVVIYDFVMDATGAIFDFKELLRRHTGVVAAHNAGFESTVLAQLQGPLWTPKFKYHDTAVTASYLGLSRSLAASTAQLLPYTKLEEGQDLIRLFCMPNETFDFKAPTAETIKADPVLMEKWERFRLYCAMDAELSRQLAKQHPSAYDATEEVRRWSITERMNAIGWHVDVEMARSFQRQYEKNVAAQLDKFRQTADPKGELNLRSFTQLKKWCADRGVRAKSFNEDSVNKLHTALVKQLDTLQPGDDRRQGYEEVLALMETKKALGGSSLSKLETLLAQTSHGSHKLHDQYMHLGASQTFRTTGRGVQLQNLKRLSNPAQITSSTIAEEEDWTNEEMANNLRQLFTASEPGGALVVGDFSSVESRGLAWLAGEEWKLQSYRDKKDLYKVLASQIFATPYEQVDKSQRQVGKVGELSCGYGAGGGAVQSFADGMGVEMSRDEASQLVFDWRQANPKIVQFWNNLQEVMEQGLERSYGNIDVGPEGNGFSLTVVSWVSPESLLKQHPGAKDMVVRFMHHGTVLFERRFRGVYKRGKDICYHKPTSLKTGELWKSHFVDPKTKEKVYYKIYGGKLAGILTQSLCREIFFGALGAAQYFFEQDLPLGDTIYYKNTAVMGQFHDEIVVDWVPRKPYKVDGRTLYPAAVADVQRELKRIMSNPRVGSYELIGFPLEAEVNYDYRYIK